MSSKTHSVRLVFKSAFAKQYFMGQLSDGWGENEVALSNYKGNPEDVEEVTVEPFGDVWEHAKAMERKYPRGRTG